MNSLKSTLALLYPKATRAADGGINLTFPDSSAVSPKSYSKSRLSAGFSISSASLQSSINPLEETLELGTKQVCHSVPPVRFVASESSPQWSGKTGHLTAMYLL